MENNQYICPACNSTELTAKYEAKYVYSYIIDSNAPGLKNDNEFLSFLYDKREQVEARQYIECNICKTQYPCFFTEGNKGIDFKVLKKAINMEQSSES
jgi:hypothetical protein